MWLAREGLEREPSQVWNSLAAASADIEALPVFGDLRRAYDDGLIEEGAVSSGPVERILIAGTEQLAFRAGVNIVMYTLTGNYKADQVHIPALLERLGQ